MTTGKGKVAAVLGTILCLTSAAADALPRTDAYGDPLPPGALLRLGTVRWRSCARFLAFTPDGKTLVTGEVVYQGSVIRCWDTATGKETGGFRVGHLLMAFALSPDGKTLALNSGEDLKGVAVVSVTDGKEIRRFEGISTYLDCLDFSPDGKTLAALDGQGAVRLFDVESGKAGWRLTGETNRFYSMAFSPDGKKLALVGRDNTLRVLEIAAQKELFRRKIRRDEGRPLDVSFSPDGKKLAWMGEDAKTFALWDAETGAPVLPFRGSPERIRSVHFSPDGKRIASSDANRDSIRLWDAETGKELRRIAALLGGYDVFAFSPDGKQLASVADWEGVVRLWDVETGKELRRIGEHQGAVCSVSFSPDGRTAVTGCMDRVVRTWDVDRGTVLRRIEVGEGVSPFYETVFSGDRKAAAVGGCFDPTDLWDLDSGKKRVRLDGGDDKPWKVVFAPDGKTLAANGTFPGVRLWDAETGKAAARVGAQLRGIKDFAFAPDGKTLAVETQDFNTNSSGIILLEASTGKELLTWTPRNRVIFDVKFSPNGRLVAAAGSEEVNVWDVATGKERPPLVLSEGTPAAGSMNCLAFSPDGRTLAAGSSSGVVYLWEVSTARLRAVLRGHRDVVTSLDFAPDGARLISGSCDTTALIWDLTGLADEADTKTLAPERLAALWDELADADAGKAWRAGWRLTADPAASVPFLQKRLRPAEVDAARIAKLLAALDGDDFEEREKASRELAKLGELAGPAVRQALAGKPSPEARRRLEGLARKLDGPVEAADEARALRCVEALEHIGTADARRLLDELGKGAEGARVTREAKAALERLAKAAPSH